MSDEPYIQASAANTLLIAALVKLLERNGTLPVGLYASELSRTLSDKESSGDLPETVLNIIRDAIVIAAPENTP